MSPDSNTDTTTDTIIITKIRFHVEPWATGGGSTEELAGVEGGVLGGMFFVITKKLACVEAFVYDFVGLVGVTSGIELVDGGEFVRRILAAMIGSTVMVGYTSVDLKI